MKQNADSLRTITSISLHLLWGKRERQRERETETERGERERERMRMSLRGIVRQKNILKQKNFKSIHLAIRDLKKGHFVLYFERKDNF